jgi:preprotein translocase subunit YajC
MNTLTHSLIFAQADAPAGGGFTTLIFFAFIFAGMWFLIIAPQRKRQKQHEAMIRAIQSGDKIVTAGGIIGTVTNVKDDRITVKIAENTKVEINRSFVHAKLDASAE